MVILGPTRLADARVTLKVPLTDEKPLQITTVPAYWLNMKMHPFLILSLLGLFACSDETSPTSLRETSDPLSPVQIRYLTTQSFSFESQSESGILTISKSIPSCDGESLVQHDSVVWTFQSLISKGTLYLWDSLQCTGLKFGGGHTTLSGDWEFIDTLQFPIEDWDARVDPNCDQVNPADWQTKTLAFSGSSAVVQQVRDSFCLIENEPLFQSLKSKGYRGSSLTIYDCVTFEASYGTNKATLEITQYDPNHGSYEMKFLYDGKSCSEVVRGTPSTCPIEAPSQSDLLQLTACINDTGFFTSP